MQYNPQHVDEKVVHELNEKDVNKVPIEDKIASLAREMLVSSQIYKQPRMNTIAVYERLYNNDVLPKLRQMFNSVLPIFSGMVDELLAMFNDQLQLKFKALNPMQELVIPKLQSHWNSERDSLAPNAMWNYKARSDRFNAVLSGRGIIQEFAYNDPEYTNVVNVINYSDFHCQPNGGGLLEKHLFCGTEGNFKTLYDLKTSGKYDQKKIKEIETYAWSDRLFENLETTYGTKFARWKALGLDVETNNFTGELTYNFCDFIITYNGVRYNVVFEPTSGIWIYCKPWIDTMPSGKYPFKSWATHEDDKNFWSKSYSDDFFTIADSVITLFNQELTNREKKNYNARAFDKDMFQDVAKLDAAQYRPDALVPANTAGGTKTIASGIYAFDTPELKGTIDLISWMSEYTGQKTGADELPPASGKNKVAIQMMQQKKQSNRVGLRSASFKECYQQLGETFIEGLVEFMPPILSIQMIGENGFIEDAELKRIDVKNMGKIGIAVTSSSEQESGDDIKKQGQVQAIEMVAQNPTMTRYEKEVIYRNIGQFSESEIMFLLDQNGALSRKQYAHASAAIQNILLGKEPDIYYGADMAYAKYIQSYLIDNKTKVRGKEDQFMKFIEIITPIVQSNAQQQAQQQPPQQQGQDNKSQSQQQPQQKPQQQPQPKMS